MDGKLTSLQCFDTAGTATGDICPISIPALLQGIGEYKAYVQANLLWPEAAIKQ